jgi:hypothetical protein
VYEDELCVAFRDIAPAAPVHVLLIPRKPIPSIAAATAEDAALLAHLMLKVGDIARAEGIEAVLNGHQNSRYGEGNDADQFSDENEIVCVHDKAPMSMNLAGISSAPAPTVSGP